MYIKVDGNYADFDFNCLSKFLFILDTELSQVNADISSSLDPDSDGLCDYGEYLIGHGYVAIQRYMGSTYPQTNITKEKALNLGPKIAKDLTFAQAINAGANYWKHLEEWGLAAVAFRDINKLSGLALSTIATIEKLTPWSDYTCSNLLACLSPRQDLQFSVLLPSIVEWRAAL